MKKLGPILAIFSGIVTLVLSTLGILASEAIIKSFDFMGNYTSDVASKATDGNTTVTVLYGVMIAVGVIQIALGTWAFKNSKGFAAFILLIIFVGTTTLAIINGVKADSFPTGTIVQISINAIASIGLLAGFAAK